MEVVGKDLYADRGIIPPSIYEELHYAEKLCEHLGWGEKADALWERIENAKKWDNGAIYSIRDMLKDGYTTLCGETVLFREHFGRNGIFPVHNKLDELDYSYISRWKNKWTVESLKRLPLYKETDTIAKSTKYMDFVLQTLLMDSNALNKEHQTPENQLWRALDPSVHSEEMKDGMLFVENHITGQRVPCHKENFLGVMRPDIIARLDFDALKKEYAHDHCEDTCSVDAENDENEFER